MGGMKQEERTFTLDELCALVDLPRRTVRYYIQVALVDRPAGAGRGAHYARRHLAQLLEIRKWQAAGLSLERIRELLAPAGEARPLPPPRPRRRGSVEVWSHLVIDEGIELMVEPRRAALSPEQVRALASAVMALYTELRAKKE
jgi:DNA-binding transcriptional MerR regulator